MLKAGDVVRSHIFGSTVAGWPDCTCGVVREISRPSKKGGLFKVLVYWFADGNEYWATITQASGNLYRTKADNIFVKLENENAQKQE